MNTGFFGGAFDPFHTEHKNVIIHAKEELNLDRVVVYPSALPPHKNCVADFSERKKMADAALKDLDYVITDDVENGFEGVNPTVKILPVLMEKYPSDNSWFIIGGDSLVNFHKWIKPEEIAKITKIAVVPRENKEETEKAAESVRKQFGATVRVLEYVGKEVSSSLIKGKIETGETPEGIDEEVLRIIKEDGLYSEHAEMVKKLRENMKESRFEHVKRTTYFALKYSSELGLDYGKVFKAAMLHDCAKHLKIEMPGVPGPVVHQFAGTETARTEYGITDEEILSAIACHTTGKANMTKLDKLIFTADILEEGRDFPGVEELRKAVSEDFEKGFVVCVNSCLEMLKKSGKEIHPLTEECAAYYNNKKR